MLNIKDDILRQFNSIDRILIPDKEKESLELLLITIFKERVGINYNGDYIAPAAKKISNHICGRFSTGLLFHGAPGSGKTIMMEILIAVINKYSKKRFKLFDSRQVYKCLTGRVELSTPIDEATYVFIDELGEEPLMYFNEYPLVSFIMSKYRDRKLIFCTTNMNSSIVEEHYGGRISSRVLEMFTPISFGNVDFRKINSKKHK